MCARPHKTDECVMEPKRAVSREDSVKAWFPSNTEEIFVGGIEENID